MSTNNTYVTSDLYLTSYLKVKGFKFKISKVNSKSNFVFESSDDLLTNVNEYFAENGLCEPLAFTNAIKNIKNLLHNTHIK